MNDAFDMLEMRSNMDNEMVVSQTAVFPHNINITLRNIDREEALVSVIIPCFNQARFLGEAIESVLTQSYAHFEIIVVDDGSTDQTAKIAQAYKQVRYLYQENQGLSAARNCGIEHSSGNYLLFLDADDRLLPKALASGVASLRQQAECAFVSAHYRYVAEDGRPLPTWREQRTGDESSFISGNYHLIGEDDQVLEMWPQAQIKSDHYTTLLQRNYIAMHATVMYRHEIFAQVGGFDRSLPACEDYDLYLRIARQFPVACHDEVVAEYRLHGGNMTRGAARMQGASLRVLEAQRPFVQNNPGYQAAYETGMRFWRKYYGRQLWPGTWDLFINGDMAQARGMAQLARRHSQHEAKERRQRLGRYLQQKWQQHSHRWQGPAVGEVNWAGLKELARSVKAYDIPQGQTVIPYYVERFLVQHTADIQGNVLAAGDDAVVYQYGIGQVRESHVLPVTADAAGGIQLDTQQFAPNSVDCMIVSQYLHRVFDVKTAVSDLHRLLKPGGVLLVTLPGFHNHHKENDWYWGFTNKAAQKLFHTIFSPQTVTIQHEGNVLTATAFLNDLPTSQFRPEELNRRDKQYQLLLTVRAVKSQ